MGETSTLCIEISLVFPQNNLKPRAQWLYHVHMSLQVHQFELCLDDLLQDRWLLGTLVPNLVGGFNLVGNVIIPMDVYG